MTKKIKLLAISALFAASSGMCSADPMFNKDGVLRFDFTPDEIKSFEPAVKADFEKAISQIIALKSGDRTFENTIWAFERAFSNVDQYREAFELYVDFLPDAKLREASDELKRNLDNFLTGVYLRRDIYDALTKYIAPSDLDKDKKIITDKIFSKFRDNGLDLTGENLDEYKKLKSELTDLESGFAACLNNTTTKLKFNKKDMEGMGQQFLDGLEKTKDGKYIVSTKRTEYYPFMENAKSDKARKKLEKAFYDRCHPQNEKKLVRALKIRAKIAKLMGYENWVDFVAKNEMAKNAKTIKDFLENLAKDIQPKAKQEMAAILETKRKAGNPGADRINQWELDYWANEYKKTGFNVDGEKIKEYFPAERVISEMLNLYGEMFGVEFVKADVPVWDKDVKAFKMLKNGKARAYVYMDVYPREGKYQSAENEGVVKGRMLENGNWQIPSTIFLVNVPRPTADKPSLMSAEQVQTLFHEFGHSSNEIFTQAKYRMVSGSNMARDFVETPSTFSERYCAEPAVLKRISGHYKNGSKIPDELLESVSKADKATAAKTFLFVLHRAMFDHYIHTAKDGVVDMTKLEKKLWPEVRLVEMMPGIHPQSNFSHIMFSGYSGRYYSYIWSDVIASDILSVFGNEGLFNKNTAARYESLILGTAGMYGEKENAEKFLMRGMSNQPFLEKLGVK